MAQIVVEIAQKHREAAQKPLKIGTKPAGNGTKNKLGKNLNQNTMGDGAK
jgi:hypothetical protein